MTPNGEKCENKSEEQRWHYLAVKKLSELLKGTASKNHRNFDCLNWSCSFPTENKRESHNKLICNVIMLSEYTKMLEFSQNQKSDKAPFIIYA